MALCNRDKDASEQPYVVEFATNTLTAVSATLYAGIVSSPGQLLQSVVAGWGLSGTPAYTVQIHRWTSGGATVIAPGSAITFAVAYGVSGGLSGETYNAASSLAAVQVGDVLVLKSSGANTASLALVANFVIKATQDIKKTHSI